MDLVVIMEIGRNVGRRALAVLFTEMAAQKGHNLKEQFTSVELNKEINAIFYHFHQS